MSDAAAEVIVNVGIGCDTAASALAQLESQLDRTSTKADKTGKAIGDGVGNGMQKGRDATLAFQSSIAATEASTGNYAAAIQRLEGALAASTQTNSQTLSVERQLISVRAQAAAAVDKKAAASQRAAAQEAQQAQALARAQLQAGQYATAIRTLEAAQQRAGTTELQSIQIENQLTATRQRAAAAAEKEIATQNAIANSAGGTQSKLGALTTAMGGLGLAFSAGAVASYSVELIKTGVQAESTRKSFDSLARTVGTTGAALISGLRGAAQGTVSDAKLIESANSGILLTGGKLATDLPRLLQIARASAQATGDDVGFIFDSLVKGIARGSPQIIDNAKITLDAAGAFEAYAQKVGKSVDSLSNSERQQATLNAVLQAGTKIIADTGGVAETTAVKIARIEAAAENAKVALGQMLAVRFEPLITGASQLVEAMNGTRSSFEGLQGGLQAVGAYGAATFNPVIQGISAYNSWVLTTGANLLGYNTQQQQANATALQGAQTYQQYTTALQQTAPGMQALTQTQFQFVQGLMQSGQTAQQAAQNFTGLNATQQQYALSLTQTGMSAQQALTQVQGLQDVSASMDAVIASAQSNGDAFAGTLAALGPAALEAASGSAANQEAVLNLIAQYSLGQITADTLSTSITNLAAQHMAAATAAATEAGFHAQRTGEIQAGTVATDALTTALGSEGAQSAINAVNSETLALKKQQLAQQAQIAANALLASGSSGAAAAAKLASSSSLVDQLTAAYYRLAAAQAAAGQAGQLASNPGARAALSNQRDGERQGGIKTPGFNQSVLAAEKARDKAQEAARKAEQAATKKPRGGGGGGGGGGKGKGGGGGGGGGAPKLSDAQKLDNSLLNEQTTYQNKSADAAADHQQKVQELERSHTEKLLDIQDQYAQKRKDAAADLNDDILDGQADFYETLVNMDDQDAAAKMDAQYQQMLAGLPAIAEQYGSDVADKYMEAQEKIIQARGKRQAEIEKAEKDKNSDRAEALRGVDQLKRQAEDRQLDRTLHDPNSINNQESKATATENEKNQEAVAKENERYSEQQDKLATDTERASQRKIVAAQQSGKAIDVENASLEKQATTLERINAAAGAKGSRAPGAGASVGAPPSDLTNGHDDAARQASLAGTAVGPGSNARRAAAGLDGKSDADAIVKALDGVKSAIVDALKQVERAERDTASKLSGLKSNGGAS